MNQKLYIINRYVRREVDCTDEKDLDMFHKQALALQFLIQQNKTLSFESVEMIGYSSKALAKAAKGNYMFLSGSTYDRDGNTQVFLDSISEMLKAVVNYKNLLEKN